MGKALTKSEIASALAEKHGLAQSQIAQILDSLAELAYQHAADSFTVPGLGKLILMDRKERMGRNPATGAAITIPAKKVLKFRIAKAAKDAVLAKK